MNSPEHLWRSDVLHLPRDVDDVYEHVLKNNSLYDAALQYRGQHGIHGGSSKVETDRHFACLYSNSVSRVQYVLLDPHSVFESIPRDLMVTLSSHRISILDLPCGAGAGAISLLGTIKELRSFGHLPTIPLTVDILGADISPHALALYKEQIELLKPKLSEAGITVNLECTNWDASDVQDTNSLFDFFLDGPGPNEYLVLVANFSGASKQLFESFSPSFEQIWIRMSSAKTQRTTILWVEPDGDSSMKLVVKLTELLSIPYTWFKSKFKSGAPCKMLKFNFFHRIQNKAVGSGVTVQTYTRDGKR